MSEGEGKTGQEILRGEILRLWELVNEVKYLLCDFYDEGMSKQIKRESIEQSISIYFGKCCTAW